MDPPFTPILDHAQNISGCCKSVLFSKTILALPSLPPHWPLPECVSAGPVFNTRFLQGSLCLYPKGLLLQPPFLHRRRCPAHSGLSVAPPHALQAERSAPVCFALERGLPRINLLPIPMTYLLNFVSTVHCSPQHSK